MLVLARKRDESIVIDPRTCPLNEQGLIEVTVIAIRGDKVRLGVTAPRPVNVHRREVFDAIERQRKEPRDGRDRAA